MHYGTLTFNAANLTGIPKAKTNAQIKTGMGSITGEVGATIDGYKKIIMRLLHLTAFAGYKCRQVKFYQLTLMRHKLAQHT